MYHYNKNMMKKKKKNLNEQSDEKQAP